MRFSTISAAAVAFVASATAQIAGFNVLTKPQTGEVVDAGSTYTIEWTPSSLYPGVVSLALIGGETPATLVPLGTFATGVDGSAGKYNWAVDSSLGKDKTYGIQITLESNTTVFQYSFPFSIKSSGSSSSSASASVSASVSAASVSSSPDGYPTAAVSKTTSYPASYPASSDAASYPASSYAASSYPTVSSSVVPSGNLSTTLTRSSTGSTTATRSSTSSIPTAAAPRIAAGSLALVGGIAAAVFAL